MNGCEWDGSEESADDCTCPPITDCPDCHAPAEIVDRYTLESTSGPVVHIATACAADRSHNYVQTLN